MNHPSKRPRDVVNKFFDDALLETAADERGDPSPDDVAEHERWLRDNVPPHHD